MKLLTFEAWREINKSLLDDLEKSRKEQECPDCNGQGDQECDLGFTHDCGQCDGTGYKDLIERDRPDKAMRILYNQSKSTEVQKLVRWGIVVNEFEMTSELPTIEIEAK